MANLRIVSDNAAGRATLAASTTAGTLTAANLLTDIKSDVWRATSTSASLTLTWSAAELISGVALPFCNLTPAATIRVRGYTNAGDATAAFDTGAVAACPATTIKVKGWPVAGCPSIYAYGGGACARAWFTVRSVRKLVVDLADAGNPAGYVEASRLIVGAYWSPISSADYGVPLLLQDFSKHYRTEAGDLMTDIGTRARKLPLNLSMMPPADRNAFINILRSSGLANPIFLSLFPESSDLEQERDYQIYGKLSSISAITLPNFGRYSSTLDLEEI